MPDDDGDDGDDSVGGDGGNDDGDDDEGKDVNDNVVGDCCGLDETCLWNLSLGCSSRSQA